MANKVKCYAWLLILTQLENGFVGWCSASSGFSFSWLHSSLQKLWPASHHDSSCWRSMMLPRSLFAVGMVCWERCVVLVFRSKKGFLLVSSLQTFGVKSKRDRKKVKILIYDLRINIFHLFCTPQKWYKLTCLCQHLSLPSFFGNNLKSTCLQHHSWSVRICINM